MKLKEIINKLDKSSIKAGEGNSEGLYPLFTCSPIVSKYLDSYMFDKEALVLSTGGNFAIHYINGKFNYSTDCYAFNTYDYNLKYLYYYLSSKSNDINKIFRGAGLKHLNKNEFLLFEIKETDKEKQSNVVAILDKVEFLIKLRKKEINNYDFLIKSQFVEMFDDPVENPKQWKYNTLKDLGTFGRGVSMHRPRNAQELLNGPYPLIQTGDVSNSDLYINGYYSTYSELGLKQSKLWPSGTLCITIAANIAQTSILTFDACFPDSVVGFIANDKTNNIFMHYWFEFLQKTIDSKATQVAQKNINLQTLSKLNIITPPIELQNKFASIVEQIDKQKFVSENISQMVYETSKSWYNLIIKFSRS